MYQEKISGEKWPWIKTIRGFWYFIGLLDKVMHCKSWLFFTDESLMRKRYLARLKVSDQVGHNHIKINTDRRKDKSDIPPSPFIIRDTYPSYTEIVCAHILLSCLYYVFTGCAKTCNLSRLIFWTLGTACCRVVDRSYDRVLWCTTKN